MKIETRHVDIHGLNCPNCATKVERAVAALPGVHRAEVQFETERATFEYTPTVVSLELIASIVKNACESNQFTISVDGHQITPDNSQTISGDEIDVDDVVSDDDEHTTDRQRDHSSSSQVLSTHDWPIDYKSPTRNHLK